MVTAAQGEVYSDTVIPHDRGLTLSLNVSTLKITFLGLQRFAPFKRFAPYKKLPVSPSHALIQPSYSLHAMIGCSPLETYPLPGTSRTAQQTPPPYSSPTSNDTLRQPRTRSVPFSSGVTMEWGPDIAQSPDDIILVTVRIHQLGRRGSFEENLPQR